MSHSSVSVPDDRRLNGEAGRSRRRLPVFTRLFIVCSVVSIVVRSSLNTFMHHTDWVEELGMFTVPLPLPGAAERDEISRHRSARSASLYERMSAVGASVVRFASPLPTQKTSRRLTTPKAWLAYAAVWVHTRLEFMGRIIGVDERWTMFSPTVGTRRTAVRAVLTYADGSSVEVRSLAEPADFTRFVRPFAQRRLQHDVNLAQLDDVRWNWCKYLARKHPSRNGSELRSIGLYRIQHALAPPGVDPVRHWEREDSQPLPGTPTWHFDVGADTLTAIESAASQTEATDDVD